MKLTGVNTSTWTKVCLIATLFTTNSTCTGLTSNVGFHDNTVTMLWARQPRNCCLMTQGQDYCSKCRDQAWGSWGVEGGVPFPEGKATKA